MDERKISISNYILFCLFRNSRQEAIRTLENKNGNIVDTISKPTAKEVITFLPMLSEIPQKSQ